MSETTIGRRGFLARSFGVMTIATPVVRAAESGAAAISGMKAYGVAELRVPVAGANAVTAMAVGDDGMIYCGLTGKRRVLVALDPRTDGIRDVGEIFPDDPKTRGIDDKIHNSLVKTPDGNLYIGQGLNISDGYPREFNALGYDGGHLFRYEPGSGRISDLGPQVRGEAIQGLTADPKGRYLAGYTIPGNHFFVHDLATHQVADYGRISQPAHHNMVCDGDGVTWGCWNCALAREGMPVKTGGCYLIRYDHGKRSFERTNIAVPTEPFSAVSPAKNKSWNNGFDSACRAGDGSIYFGTSIPGNLCRLRPGASEVELLGQPVTSSRIPALSEAADGRIIGFGGFPQMQLFAFDPAAGSIRNHGVVAPQYPLCLFHAMAVLPDGRIYAGETDSGRANIYRLTPRG